MNILFYIYNNILVTKFSPLLLPAAACPIPSALLALLSPCAPLLTQWRAARTRIPLESPRR